MSYYYIAGDNILLPNIQPKSYEIIGWNWFNFKKCEWNSCAFRTKEHAITAYKDVYNVKKVNVSLNFSDFAIPNVNFPYSASKQTTDCFDEDLFEI